MRSLLVLTVAIAALPWLLLALPVRAVGRYAIQSGLRLPHILTEGVVFALVATGLLTVVYYAVAVGSARLRWAKGSGDADAGPSAGD